MKTVMQIFIVVGLALVTIALGMAIGALIGSMASVLSDWNMLQFFIVSLCVGLALMIFGVVAVTKQQP